MWLKPIIFKLISVIGQPVENTIKVLPLLQTPSGPRISVLSSERSVIAGILLFQSNVCNLFFSWDLAVVHIVRVSVIV